MQLAIELAARCPPADGAYSVGAVIVAADGQEMARGYSRDTGGSMHAEQSALAGVTSGDPRLPTATLYSTLEPCGQRRSAPQPCAALIAAAGIGRVVFAWREPALFVPDPSGIALLTAAGVAVTELAEFTALARAVNAHLPISGSPPHE